MYRDKRSDRFGSLYPHRSDSSTESSNSNTRSTGKFWIYVAIIFVYMLLIGIIVLVLLVLPKSPMNWTKVAQYQNRTYYTSKTTNEIPTRPPFRTSPYDPDQPPYRIDPRSDLPQMDENEILTRRPNSKFPTGF